MLWYNDGPVPTTYPGPTRSPGAGTLDGFNLGRPDLHKDPNNRVTSQVFMGKIIQEYNLNELQMHKEAQAQKKNSRDHNKNSRSNKTASGGGSGSHVKAHCSHCRCDNHNDADCHFKGQTKCNDCNHFHFIGQKCWDNKCKGKAAKTYPNKKKKESNNAEVETQVNATTEGRFQEIDSDEEDNEDIVDNYVNITSSSKATVQDSITPRIFLLKFKRCIFD